MNSTMIIDAGRELIQLFVYGAFVIAVLACVSCLVVGLVQAKATTNRITDPQPRSLPPQKTGWR